MAAIAGYAARPIYQRSITLGIARSSYDNLHGSDLKVIPNTVACEDLHYEPVSNKLYTSCQVSGRAKM